MAQVNIAHFTDIKADEMREFALQVRDIVAREVHGLKPSEIQPDSVSVLVMPIDTRTSLSGADTEIHVVVSGNNWPADGIGQPASAATAKIHFDKLAASIHRALAKESERKLYIWVTPFTASGWAT